MVKEPTIKMLEKYFSNKYRGQPVNWEIGTKINCNDEIRLVKSCSQLPCNFGKVTSFECIDKELTTLIGSPKIVKQYFN